LRLAGGLAKTGLLEASGLCEAPGTVRTLQEDPAKTRLVAETDSKEGSGDLV